MANNEAQTIEKREAQTPEGVERMSARRVFMPRADICEIDDGIVVLADMPGVDEKTVDITLEKNVLTISGRVEVEEPKNHNLVYAEYEVGDYQRVFTLSDEIDRDGITAVVKNGVLRLVLPKAPQAKTRKIAVKAE
ncbi:MAG TPA: Hsp20/alpha crystallin family protein [Planctomycetota bacterium]|jgi:HSP20 family molecular chaperone IbpA